MAHSFVIEEVGRAAAQALPLPIEVERQILTHADETPPQVTVEPGEDGPQAVPEGEDPPLLASWHPAMPAGARAEGEEAVDAPRRRHDPEGMAGIGVAEDEEGPVRVGHEGQRRGQVEPTPVEIVHAQLLQVRRT